MCSVCVMTWYWGVCVVVVVEREKKRLYVLIYVIDNIKNINKINDNTTVVYIFTTSPYFFVKKTKYIKCL